MRIHALPDSNWMNGSGAFLAFIVVLLLAGFAAVTWFVKLLMPMP